MGSINLISIAVGSITGLGANVATFLATPSSANLLAAVTDETGTGALVFGTSPTITTSLALNGTFTQTSTSATAFESGPNGATNPTLRLVCNVASAATGLSITGNASGAGVTLTALGGTNEAIRLQWKGTSGVGIGTAPATNVVFHVKGPSTAYLAKFESTDADCYNQFLSTSGSGEFGIFNDSFYFQALNTLANGIVFLPSSSTTHSMILTQGGKVGIGIGVGSSLTYGLQILPTSGVTAGLTMLVQDGVATTGQTKVIFKGGAVAGTIFEIQNSSATVNATISDAGVASFKGTTVTTLTATGNLSFFAASAAAQQTSGANLTNSVTSGGTDNTIADFAGTLYSTDASTIRDDIYQLARKLKQINDGLRTYGLFT